MTQHDESICTTLFSQCRPGKRISGDHTGTSGETGCPRHIGIPTSEVGSGWVGNSEVRSNGGGGSVLGAVETLRLVVEASVVERMVEVAAVKSAFTKCDVDDAKMPFCAHKDEVVAAVITA